METNASMRANGIIAILALSILGGPLYSQTTSQDKAADLKPNQGAKVRFRGYVRDLACLVKFNEALKPTNDCAAMCARAGSPLVIITKKGIIYFPISEAIPDTSQREKLMPFVGSYVEINGETFQRSGINAIVIEQVKKVHDTAP